MDCMDGTLQDFILSQDGIPPDPSIYQNILKQVLKGLDHIHSHQFIHRDIKPENILITGDISGPNLVVKVADFNLSKDLSDGPDDAFTSYIGTRWYRAPEVLIKCERYSTAIDIWAFAAVAYEMATCCVLFEGRDQIHQLKLQVQLLGAPGPNSVCGEFQPLTNFLEEMSNDAYNEIIEVCDYLNFEPEYLRLFSGDDFWQQLSDECRGDIGSTVFGRKEKRADDENDPENQISSFNSFSGLNRFCTINHGGKLVPSYTGLSDFNKLLLPILRWDPSTRPTAGQLLCHPILADEYDHTAGPLTAVPPLVLERTDTAESDDEDQDDDYNIQAPNMINRPPLSLAEPNNAPHPQPSNSKNKTSAPFNPRLAQIAAAPNENSEEPFDDNHPSHILSPNHLYNYWASPYSFHY
ncbi:protein kinase IME2 [Sugiyamaella lignohabitans]|uniref:Protein kinase IME2 n=1 Tax=Sugiyamaella lignohabitans TaxID=796027 RepID=A0A161HH19_9ASCO|nr:protein kinase IME2 [Sugiyamaella lignohabitans]ANB11247.1 protein kinase IME2 [Sugiyamaella lignohabitans]